jgi:hypothetical protein
VSQPKIPLKATPEVQEAFRQIWLELERLNGKNNVDYHGKRVINAGDSVDPGDYVTQRELGEFDLTLDATITAADLTGPPAKTITVRNGVVVSYE